MEPIAIELLMALAGGTAGAVGQQAWDSLRALVRRRPRPELGDNADHTPEGQGELIALNQDPTSIERAQALAVALAGRALRDPDFAEALATWQRETQSLRTGAGNTHNEISGGIYQAPVIQARDIHGGGVNYR